MFLEFKKLKDAHTGINLVEVMYNTLNEFSLYEKLFCITIDNVSNNNIMFQEFQDLLYFKKDINWSYETHDIYFLSRSCYQSLCSEFPNRIEGIEKEKRYRRSDDWWGSREAKESLP